MGLIGNDINACDEEGWFPILRMCAAEQGYSVASLKSLIRQGADVHVRTPKKGRTALHLACLTGKPAFVGPLLDAGVDIGALDEKGATVKLVIKAGGNPWERDQKGNRAFHYLDHPHIPALQSALKAYVKGREINMVRSIYTQQKFSRTEVYEMLPDNSPAKQHFHATLALPLKSREIGQV